jgi:hypothetical protein
MPEQQENTLKAGFKETKDVLLLVITLGKAYENAKADGNINWADITHLFPVIFLIGDALEGIENVKLELVMATPEEGEELKAWVKSQVDLQDDEVEAFIEACFAVVLDIWMVFKKFFFPQEGMSKFITSGANDVAEAPKAAA